MKTMQTHKPRATVAKATTVRNPRRQRRKTLPPGIYRARVGRCEAVMNERDTWDVSFEFFVEGPEHAYGWPLRLSLPTGEAGGADYACRVFAVTGVPVNDDGDLPLACREVVGRHLYLEVLDDGELHVQQLAVTHRVAVPPSVPSLFPAEGDSRRHRADPDAPLDLSDPFYPRFHGCDITHKAELRLYRHEQARVTRVRQR